MKITLEYIIIAILSIALIYYFFARFNLVSDLSVISHDNNPKLKAIKEKHKSGCHFLGDHCCTEGSTHECITSLGCSLGRTCSVDGYCHGTEAPQCNR
jgi:hypothetical protein